jgi:hypothetical protein
MRLALSLLTFLAPRAHKHKDSLNVLLPCYVTCAGHLIYLSTLKWPKGDFGLRRKQCLAKQAGVVSIDILRGDADVDSEVVGEIGDAWIDDLQSDVSLFCLSIYLHGFFGYYYNAK